MTGLRATWLVAVREASERARSRAYLVSTIFTLVIIGMLIVVSVLTQPGTETYDVATPPKTPWSRSSPTRTSRRCEPLSKTRSSMPR
jgi:hypothetical protein